MKTSTAELFCLFILAAPSLNCSGAEAGDDANIEVGVITASTETTSVDPSFVGTWLGNWSTDASDTDNGTVSLTVSRSGDVTGQMEFASSEEQQALGVGTLTGHASGGSVTFTYKFSAGPLHSGTGRFSPVTQCRTTLLFDSTSPSKVAGHFDLAEQSCFVAHIPVPRTRLER